MTRRKSMVFLSLYLVWGIILLFGQTSAVQSLSTSSVPIVHDTITPDLTISFALTINNTPQGEVEAGVWNNEAIIEKNIAAQLLFDYLRPDIYSTIFTTLFKGLTWLSAEDFSIAGITFEFDSSALSISITIPPEYAPVVDIDFVPEQVPNYKPILRPAPFAGYIRDESSIQVSSASSNSLLFSTNLSSMIDIKGTHLFGAGYISLTNNSSVYHFNNLYARWNNNANKLQISLGLLTIPGTSSQTRPQLYAISLTSVKNQPYIVRQGYIDEKTEFTIHKLAKVTVEVNGRSIRQVLLAPGNYRILDLPFTSGLNEFVLHIEETDGTTQVLRRIVPRDNNILNIGTDEFALSAGASTTDWSEFLASGYYLYGLLPTLSGGINLQADKRSTMAGITWTSALPIGNLNGSASVVGRWDGWGECFAPAASINYLFSMPQKDNIPSFGISATYHGYGFLSPGISGPTTSTSVPDAYISLSTNLYSRISKHTSAGLSYSFTRTESVTPTMTHGLYASLSHSLKSGGSISLSAQASIPTSGTLTFSATVGFSIMPKDVYTRSFNYTQSTDGNTSLGILDKVSAFGRLYDISFSGSNILPGSADDQSLSLGIRNNSAYLSTNATGTLDYNSNTNTYSTTGYAQLSTTMAFVGSHIAFTREIPDSFLLITSSPSMKKEIASYKISSGSQYIAKHGHNVVIPISDYTTAILSSDLMEGALNLTPRHPFVLVSPAYRSGILFESDVIKRYMITGHLVDKNGKSIEYIPGSVYDIGGSLETSTFTDETGRFDIYDVLPGKYKIEWPEGYGTTSFELPETEEDSLDLGEIVIPIEIKK